MSTQTFPNTSAGMTAANAVPDPKYIWIDGKNIVVFTSGDIPSVDLRPTVTKWQLIQACVDAGVTEAQIDAAVLTLTAKRQRFWKHTNIIDRDNPISTGIRSSILPTPPTPQAWNAIFLAAAALDPLIV